MTVVASSLPTVKLEKSTPSKANILVIPTFRGEEGVELPSTALVGSSELKSTLHALTAVGAKGKSGEIIRIPAPQGVKADSIVAVGLDKPESLDDEAVRRAAGNVARTLVGQKHVATTLGDFGLAATVEGLILGGYSTRGIRSTKADADEAPVKVTIVSNEDKDVFNAAVIGAEAVAFARTLTNTPSNELYPASYAKYLKNEATKAGLEVEVLDKKELKKQGFGGILSVGQGSSRAPRLVRLEWNPKSAKKSVALVGKGITFDTGGISLKPGAGMWDMISDMGGSAAVAGATIAAAKLNLPVKVTAYLPLAENMPSGDATRPGDVITHYGGLTSEVLNTDAEGRLVLADAIARACEDNPDYLIETATLTGAQMVALGSRTAGVMGSDEFRDRVAELGRSVGENAWAVPLLEEHEEEIKSKAADIRNINAKREGGMQFAGTYLAQFVTDDVEWAHIDVAGPSWNGGAARGYTTPRATGVPARTIIAALQDIAAEKKDK